MALSLGARKLGVIPVVMNARAGAERIAWMINNVEVKTLAYTGECLELLEQIRAIGIPGVRAYIAMDTRAGVPGEIPLDELYESCEGAPEPDARITPDDVCLLAYTSGTTGKPKPVVHKEAEWSWTSFVMAYVLGLYFDDVVLSASPPSFIGWAHVTSAALRVAATQCCFRFDPATFPDLVAREQATHALLTPTLIRMLHARHGERPLSPDTGSLRVSVFGGEPVTADVVSMAATMFPDLVRVTALGATEGILLHSGLRSRYLVEHPDTLGKPVPGATVELRDEETGEVVTEAGRRGVLYAKGPGIAAGIWNDPEATAANFPGGWWRTGDILHRDEEGFYYFSGRSDHMFKSGGIKVYSEEVEEMLKRHPAVLDAVVVPVPDPQFGLVAFAHVRDSEPLTPEAMEGWWREQAFGGYGRPRHWHFWGEDPFPMLTAVKIDRRKLAEQARTEAGKGVTPMHGPTPRLLAGGWSFAEAPRWHGGKLWLSVPMEGRVLTIDLEGGVEEAFQAPAPMGLDWLPDGRPVVASMTEYALFVFDGERLQQYCDLSSHCVGPPNDLVADGRGRVYVGNMGARSFLEGEHPAPADLVLVDTDGTPNAVAPDLLFANGMVVSPDGRTLIVAETFGNRLTAFDIDADDGSLSGRRVFASLEGRTPDGIALDAEGAVWVASMETGEFLRVFEGGEITHRIEVPGKHAVSCALGGHEGRTLFLVTLQTAEGVTDPTEGIRRGDAIARVETAEAPAPAAARISERP